MEGSCSIYGAMRNTHQILVGELECTRPVGRPRHR
jgi:hypothetical protein